MTQTGRLRIVEIRHAGLLREVCGGDGTDWGLVAAVIRLEGWFRARRCSSPADERRGAGTLSSRF